MGKWVDFKTVREHLSFRDVLSHYGMTASGTGDQVKIICPFHDDHTPSCGINLKKNVYNCFACGAGGNVLDFVAHMEGLDPETVSDLRKAAFFAAETFGIDRALERTSNGTGKAKPKSKSSKKTVKAKSKPAAKREANDEAQPKAVKKPSNQPLTFELKLDHKHPYIGARGFKNRLIKSFGIGFANKGMMKDRICFPIHNEKGDLIAYSGRWADDELPEDVPRYLLPKGFEKSKVLFNLHRVIEQGSDAGVIVEGFWSVLRLHRESIPCVSTFGDSVSEDHAKLLVEQGVKQVILIYDGDEGGRVGTATSLPILAKHLFVKTVALDDGIKPDTMSDDLLATLPRF